MITADGRSAVEVEIEQMHFTGLETPNSPFAPALADLEIPENSSVHDSAIYNFIKRCIERFFGLEPTV
jgi:hypothetical protein